MDLERVKRKLLEAQFFLEKMLKQDRLPYGDTKNSFDNYLSAFLSASMTVRSLFHVKQDRKRNEEIKAWRDNWCSNLTPEEKRLLRFMHKDRIAEVHSTGSEREVKTHEFVPGHFYRDGSGASFMAGRPDRPPPVPPKQTYHFTIGGTEQKATEACTKYLSLLYRMVGAFETEHP
jgi:hypothetical protein